MRGKDGLLRVRHISGGSIAKQVAGAALLPELRRTLALANAGAERSGLELWDDTGDAPALLKELALELGIPVKRGERLSGVPLEGSLPKGAAAGSALALALFQPGLAGIDFLNSRLDVKPPPKISSLTIWGSVAAFVVVGGLGYVLNEWRESAAEVAELRQKRDDMKGNLETAKSFISRVNATRTWYARRPNYLECMRAITMTFPEDGRVWTASLSLREDMRGILNGRATDEKSVLDVLDKLKAGKNFADVKMLNMRGSGTRNPEVLFAVSFAFLSAE